MQASEFQHAKLRQAACRGERPRPKRRPTSGRAPSRPPGPTNRISATQMMPQGPLPRLRTSIRPLH
eukprot:14608884-Heterocapsa_arctica.AAC.1